MSLKQGTCRLRSINTVWENFVEHSPHTVLRQMLRESIVLLRHSEVALVFRFFSGGSLVSKGFLCATAFFPLWLPLLLPQLVETFGD